jgi:hypothetical protein
VRRFPRKPIDRSRPRLGPGGVRVVLLYPNGASTGITYTSIVELAKGQAS